MINVVLIILVSMVLLFLLLCAYILRKEKFSFREFKFMAKILKVFEIAVEVIVDKEDT